MNTGLRIFWFGEPGISYLNLVNHISPTFFFQLQGFTVVGWFIFFTSHINPYYLLQNLRDVSSINLNVYRSNLKLVTHLLRGWGEANPAELRIKLHNRRRNCILNRSTLNLLSITVNDSPYRKRVYILLDRFSFLVGRYRIRVTTFTSLPTHLIQWNLDMYL